MPDTAELAKLAAAAMRAQNPDAEAIPDDSIAALVAALVPLLQDKSEEQTKKELAEASGEAMNRLTRSPAFTSLHGSDESDQGKANPAAAAVMGTAVRGRGLMFGQPSTPTRGVLAKMQMAAGLRAPAAAAPAASRNEALVFGTVPPAPSPGPAAPLSEPKVEPAAPATSFGGLKLLAKLSEPHKYDGRNENPQALVSWANSVQLYLQPAGVPVDSCAAASYIQGFLAGEAARWFARYVVPDVIACCPPGEPLAPSPWTFERILTEMRERFVSPTSFREAEGKWENLHQDRADGSYMTVRELQLEMEDLADERAFTMEHDMKVKFISALTPDIARGLNRDEKLRFEDPAVTFAMLVKAALAIEQTMFADEAAEYAARQGRRANMYTSLVSTRRRRKAPAPGPKQHPAPQHPPRARNEGGGSNTASRPQQASARSQAPTSKTCYKCGQIGHLKHACPTNRSRDKMAKIERKSPLARSPPPLLVSAAIEGRAGYEAFIDSGAGEEFIRADVARQSGAWIHLYEKPLKMGLATAGSHTTVKGYCKLNVELCGVKTEWTFLIAQISNDLLIGRRFLAAHKAVIDMADQSCVCRVLKAPVPVEREPVIKSYKSKGRDAAEKAEGLATPLPAAVAAPSPLSEDEWPSLPSPALSARAEPATTLPTPSEAEALAGLEETEAASEIELAAMHPSASYTRPEDEEEAGYQPSADEVKEFRDWLLDEFVDITPSKKEPQKLPPKRAVEHRLPRVDEEKRSKPKGAYKVAHELIPQTYELLDNMEASGLWFPTTKPADASQMIQAKKDGGIRPLVDLRERNSNTEQLAMPPVDVAHIEQRIMESRFVTEGDWQGAFQQLPVADEDQDKTVFATVAGNYGSRVAQQGDRNSPVTLHRTVNHTFKGLIGRTVEAYADNIWILSEAWKKHKIDVIEAFTRCREQVLLFSRESVKVCDPNRDALGRRIRYKRMSVHPDKVGAITRFPVPETKQSLQRFMGMVEYNARFIPHLAEVAAPLTALCGNAPWRWSQSCNDAFDEVKKLVAAECELTSIDSSALAPKGTEPVHLSAPPLLEDLVTNEHPGEYIFAITDASILGMGGVLAVGENWWKARPVSYWSRKFTAPQYNYETHNQELQALVSFVDKHKQMLQSREFIWLTDSGAGTHFLTKDKEPTRKEARAYELLHDYSFKIKHIEGPSNKIADALSRQWEDEGAFKPREADEEDEATALHADSICVIGEVSARPQRSARAPARFRENGEAPRQVEKAKQRPRRENDKAARKLAEVERMRAEQAWQGADEAALRLDEMHRGEMRRAVMSGYREDPLFRKIISTLPSHEAYKLLDGYLYQEDSKYGRRLCLPAGKFRGRSIREIVLEHVHAVLGHSAFEGTHQTMQQNYWWPHMTSEVEKYCKSCPSCQACKPSPTKPQGKLHAMPMAERGFGEISIDFVGPFEMSADAQGNPCNFIFTFMDSLTGRVKLVPTRMNNLTSEKCVEIYLAYVYPDWGVPKAIRSDRDVRFISSFWRGFFESLGTTLAMSSAYHPQTNGKIERMHRDLNAIMRQLVSEEQTDWAKQVPFAQFALNERVSSASGFSPFQLTDISVPCAIPDWVERNPRVSLVGEAKRRLEKARDRLHVSRVEMTATANAKRSSDYVPVTAQQSDTPDRFWLSTKNLSLAPHRSRKWVLKFDGPFDCLDYDPKTSTYTLDLPQRYTQRGISRVHHGSQVRRFLPSDDALFPNRLTASVPVYPLDSLEVEYSKVVDDLYVNDRRILTLEVKGSGLRQQIEWPHPDITNETPFVKAYLGATFHDVHRVEDIPADRAERRALLRPRPFPAHKGQRGRGRGRGRQGSPGGRISPYGRRQQERDARSDELSEFIHLRKMQLAAGNDASPGHNQGYAPYYGGYNWHAPPADYSRSGTPDHHARAGTPWRNDNDSAYGGPPSTVSGRMAGLGIN